MPEASSEQRDYVPIGWLKPPIIPSNKLRLIENADVWQFGIFTSRMHVGWTRFVGGRLKGDYQYSVGINCNPFSWQHLDEAAKTKLENLAKNGLDARAAHERATLADLYDPDVMPEDPRKAHRALDEGVDRLYRKEPFAKTGKGWSTFSVFMKNSPRRCSPPPQSPRAAEKNDGRAAPSR